MYSAPLVIFATMHVWNNLKFKMLSCVDFSKDKIQNQALKDKTFFDSPVLEHGRSVHRCSTEITNLCQVIVSG